MIRVALFMKTVLNAIMLLLMHIIMDGLTCMVGQQVDIIMEELVTTRGVQAPTQVIILLMATMMITCLTRQVKQIGVTILSLMEAIRKTVGVP